MEISRHDQFQATVRKRAYESFDWRCFNGRYSHHQEFRDRDELCLLVVPTPGRQNYALNQEDLEKFSDVGGKTIVFARLRGQTMVEIGRVPLMRLDTTTLKEQHGYWLLSRTMLEELS